MGMFDISHFTAIINPPQSCILAVGTTQPILVPAPEEERGFKTVNVMKVTLSSDHRTVDGAVAARWMTAFKGYLENPLTFML
jgi:pyruvate dehydrogenase E2 component (dihydrolipoamide acetyltransferase)